MRGRNTSSTSISVSWEEVQAELRNGIISGYTITYQSLTENDNGLVPVGPNVRQIKITGLKEYVKYNISVVASTAKGIGPPFVLVVRTDQDSKWHNLCYRFPFTMSQCCTVVFKTKFDAFFNNDFAPNYQK